MTYANEDLHASVTWTGILNLSSISCSSKVSPMYQRGKTSMKRIAALKWWVTSQWRIQRLGVGVCVCVCVCACVCVCVCVRGWGEAGGGAATGRVRGTPPAQLARGSGGAL